MRFEATVSLGVAIENDPSPAWVQELLGYSATAVMLSATSLTS
jgi:hypothetical protein